MKRVTLILVLIFTVGANFVLAQRSVRVQGRDAPPNKQRLALVIGNAEYASAPLRNPVNDARAMSETLRRLGFEVMALENARQTDMKKAIDRFGDKLAKQGGVGLFYYSGHGMQVKGRNYMIPVGSRIAGEADVEYESVDAGRVLAKLDTAGNGMNIVIMDACRNNPFARSFRSASNGLATMDAPSGTLIAYATAPGKVAADGEGRNGLYTGQLIRHMTTPGLTLERVFKSVRSEVRRRSGGGQVPWEASSLEGEFYFAGVGAPGKGSPKVDEEEEFWIAIRDSKISAMFESYLSNYPHGRFATLARVKIRQIGDKTPAKGDNPPPSRQSGPRQITGAELNSLFSNKLIEWKGGGFTSKGTYSSNGKVFLRTREGNYKGRWWAEEERMCTMYKNYRPGRITCHKVFFQSGNNYIVEYWDGKKGKFKVISGQ